MNSLQKKIKQWLKYLIALSLHYSGHNTRVICRSGQYIVLMFHKLDDDNDVLHLSVKSETLAKTVEWSRKYGELATLSEVISTKSDQVKFCLTFDDGYKNNITIPSVVSGAPVIVYAATSFIESDKGFWAQQLQESIVNSEVESIDLAIMGGGRVELGSLDQRIELIKKINSKIKKYEPAELMNIINNISEQCGTCANDENGFMTWRDVVELSQQGVEIGGHTHDHFITSRISDVEFRRQLDLSSSEIEKRTGKRAIHFAYPNGGEKDISKNAPQVLEAAGYHSAVTTIEGINKFGDNPYLIKRFNMDDTRLRSPSGKLSVALFTTLIANRMFYN
ncbi:MAG: polysaccharide deacetylase family protein [Cellvibrionaceae bacterium]